MTLPGGRPAKLSLVWLHFHDRGIVDQVWRQRAFHCPPSSHDDLCSGEHRCVVCHSVAPVSQPCQLARVDRHGSLGVTCIIRVSLWRMSTEA
jgi:hypothetical protein